MEIPNYSQLETEELKELAAHEAASFALPDGWDEDRPHRTAYAVDTTNAIYRDDAIYLSSNKEGHILHVSIADTGSFIPQYMPAASELASRRGETFYRKGKPIQPMLPAHASRHSFSLMPYQLRPALTLHIPIDKEAAIVGAPTITRDAIISTGLDYADVEDALKHETPDSDHFKRLYDVVAALQKRRTGNDVFIGAESEEESDERQQVANKLGRLIISECMIAANISAARYMQEHDIPGIYFGNRYGRAAAEYMVEPRYHEMTMQPLYTRFASPLRRFADFANHANVVAHLEGRPYPYDRDTLQKRVEHINRSAPGNWAIRKLGDIATKMLDNLQQDAATTEDLATIFFGKPRIKYPEKRYLRRQAVGYLQEHPELAAPTINTAIEMELIEKSIPQRTDGRPLNNRYTVTTLDGEVFEGSTRKKGATPTALTIEMLGKVADIEISPIELAARLEADARLHAALLDSDKFLRTLDAKAGLGYKYDVSFDPRTKAHSVETEVTIDGVRHYRYGYGATEKEARHAAAAQLIRDLNLSDHKLAIKANRSRTKKR